jgi:C-terminal processing protease CtpA/Prc
MKTLPLLTVTVLSLSLAACGGGGGSAPVSQPPVVVVPQPDPIPPVSGVQPLPEKGAHMKLWNLCEKPRTGIDPATTLPYIDRQGTLRNELDFLRSWIHDTYLWYDEVPNTYDPAKFTNAIDYFNVLKTPAVTASGKLKDQYHFTYDTEAWEKLSTGGISLGYGVTWSRASSTALPRMWFATLIEPGTPAAAAGLKRGDQLLEIDGVDFLNATGTANLATLNAGLSPTTVGEVHRFAVRRNGETVNVSLAAAEVRAAPVQNTRTIDTATGKVGYITFNSHNAVAERQLLDAFTSLRNQNVTDLVLDLRYNGGGYLYLAAEVGFMISGHHTIGKTFERTVYNDKTPPEEPVPFRTTAYGFDTALPVRAGTLLPSLGLKRVTILTSPGTCSASESIINGLRGADIEVNLIGGTTCGKPYGFYATPNCGTTYFAVQFKGVNHKGEGDYADGIAPTCRVADDYGHALGDVNEGMLAAALRYRETGRCDAPSSRASVKPLSIVRSQVEEIKLLPLQR